MAFRSPCQLESFDFRLEPCPKNFSVERILKTIADEHRIIIFNVHIEFADVIEEEVHNLAVIGNRPVLKKYREPGRLQNFAEAVAMAAYARDAVTRAVKKPTGLRSPAGFPSRGNSSNEPVDIIRYCWPVAISTMDRARAG